MKSSEASVKGRRREAVSAVKRQSMQLTVQQLANDFIFLIDTDADYQREKVWSKSDQELLLDSIAQDIDIPKLYLARLGGDKRFEYECIDGKQRLLALSSFYCPEDQAASPLKINILNRHYTYEQLKAEHPGIAKSIDEYKLDFVVYAEENLTEGFVREIFKRLQLGIRLNSGELLNAKLGAVRDFVFKENGRDAPFLRNTKLSDKRYSRQFTLAQICINSFHRERNGEFARARLMDLQDFFDAEASIGKQNTSFVRIRNVLEIMDKKFGETAKRISSRATAVSAFLFVEYLVTSRKSTQVAKFVTFYVELLDSIEQDMKLLSEYKKPKNPAALEGFQKHVLQASVEPSAIKRRDDYLQKAFKKYLEKL